VRLVGKGLKPREGVLLGIDLIRSEDNGFLQWEHGINQAYRATSGKVFRCEMILLIH